MMNQNERVLLELIQSVDRQFQDGEDYQQCLKRKGLSVSHMLLFLGKNDKAKLGEVIKLTSKIAQKMVENSQFCQWMGSTFKMAWMKIKAIYLLGLKHNQFNLILPYEIEQQFDGDVRKYISELGRGTGVDQLKQQVNINDVVSNVQQSAQWPKLNAQIIKKKQFSAEQIKESVEIANQQLKQTNQLKLMELKDGLQKCRNSILDQLFQQNLIKSFSGEYTSGDYNQFKNQLLKIATDFKINNYQLKKQLNQPLIKDQDYYSKIINVRSKVHPIYIPDLVYLLEKNREAKSVVEGKDIVVILGVSGAGKSTLVQMMLEYELILKNSDNQLTTLVPKGGLKPQHKQFVAKASSNSVTKYVSVIELNPQIYRDQGTIYLADTPGFFDSRGLIVDASNSLSTIKAISSANSIRLIMLVNGKNWGTRSEGIKQLAKVISKLFKKYKQDQVIYFLNCFSDEELKKLSIVMKDVKDKLNASEKGDNKFYAVINHFCSLTEKAQKLSSKKNISIREAIAKIPQLVVMDPYRPNIKQISQKVMDQERRILNPSKVLDNLITPEVKQALQNEVNNLKSIITSCIQQNKIDAALYYINNLSQIAKQTQEIGDIGQAQKKQDDLKTQLQQNFSKSYEKLEKTMQGQVLSMRISNAAMLQSKQELKKLQELQKTYKKIPLFENFDRAQDISNLVRYTSESMKNKMEEQISEDLIKTIQLFSEHFDPKLKQSLIGKMQENVGKLMQEIVEVIKAQDYGNLQDKIKKFNQFADLASKNKDFPQTSQSWKTQLQKTTDERTEKCRQIFARYQGQFNLLKDSDIQELKEALEIFSRAGDYYQEPELKKIVDARKQIKKQCLALCRKFISKIKKILKQSSDNIKPEIIQDVKMCKANVIKIMEEINEIKQEIENEFNYQLGNIVGVVNAKIQSVDNQMANIQKDNEDWTAVKNIYNSIQILKKLSYVCEETQKNKCMAIISQSQQELIKKLQNFYSDIEEIKVSMDTSYDTFCRLMKAYRISVLDKKQKKSSKSYNENIMTNSEEQGQNYYREEEHREQEYEHERNQDSEHSQDKDKIVQACSKIRTLIVQKMSKVLEDMNNFIDQKMMNNEAELQNLDRAITTISKIKRILYAIKFTNFNPEQINNKIKQTESKFETSFKQTFNRLNEELLSSFRKIIHEINGETEPIKREQIYKMVKLKKVFGKLQKNGELCSILQNSGVSITDQTDNINNCLHDLETVMRRKFDQNIGDSSTIKSCFELVNVCEPLKYLDSIFKCQFQKNIADFKQQLSINVQQHGYDVNPRQFINAGNIDTSTFRKVYQFLKDYAPQTPQGKKYAFMMERLKTQIEQEDQSLKPIFTRHYGGSNIIDEDEIYKIYSAISKHLSTVAKINEIVRENEQIQVNLDTLQKISKVGQKIIEACEKKIKQKIQQGTKGHAEAESFIQRVRYLESLLQELKIPEFKEYLQKKQTELGGKSIPDYYWDQKQSKKQQRDKKYFQDQKIQYSSELANDYQTFTEQEKIKINRKIEKQIQQDLQEIKLNSKKQNEKTIKNLFKQAFDKTQNLPSDMRWKMKNIFEATQKTTLSERLEEIEAAKKKYLFKNSYDLLLAEDRPHILELYESMTDKQFDNRKSQFIKNSEDVQKLKDNLHSTFIEHFKQKDLDGETSNPKFNVIYQKYIEQATRNVRLHVDRCFNKIKQQFNTAFIEKSQESSIQIIKSLFTEVVEIVKFMMVNKKIFAKFDEKNDLLEKIIESFHAQLVKKTDELSFEAIRKTPKVLNLWYFESMCYLAAIQSLNVPDIPNILAIYDKLKPGMDKIIEKKDALCTQINNRVEKVDKIAIYSEAMKNNSDKQREKYFQEINEDLSLIESFGKSGVKLTQHDFIGLVEKISKKLKKDIEDGINRSCQDVQSGFNNVATQFNKQINVSLKIGSAVQALSFVNVDKFALQKLPNKIESCYKNCFDNLRAQSQRIEPLKNDVQNKIKNIKKQNSQKITKTKNEKQINLNLKITKLNQNLQLDIQNQPDVTKHAGLTTNCQNQIKQLKKQHEIVIKQIQKQCNADQQKANKDYERRTSGVVQAYGDYITILYKATLQINYKQQEMKDLLEKRLQNDSQSYGKRVLNNIYETLKAKNNNYATILINSHDAFKNNQAMQWQAKVKGNGVDYVLGQLKITQDKKNELKSMFERYTDQFNSWTKKYQSSPSNSTINELLEKVRTESTNLKEFYHGAGNASLINSQILLALIFALWTILSSEVEDEVVQFSYQPHPAQVIAIFLCLSFIKSDDPKYLYSKMAQIGTGQGKSVVLAGLSSYLALCDFEVNSVCYSVYLSSRDREAFAELFDKLQITSKISYGTFDNVCESLLNKQTGDSKGFRNEIKAMLEEQKPGWFGKIINKISSLFKNLLSSVNDSNKGKKIMLIDEVDVFFDPSFFGNLYCPDVCLASSQISQLMKFVWRSFKARPEIDDSPIANSMEFKNVVTKYSKLQKLFKQQIKGMILGCRGCDHDYVIRDDLIQYKDQDGISSKINYGFQTLFAYLKEHEKNKITGSSLERALKVSLIIAEFSYALLPKYFRSIIGVTGTYENMSSFKKKYMETEYQVKAAYAIPSVYGNVKRREINKAKIVPPDQHYAEIIKQIKEVHATERPVLVFFKSATDLETFYNLAAYQDLQAQTSFLNETHAANQRDLRIKMTCNRKKITLMTNSFGRGTDFKVFDESLYKIGHGGLHVIQTFLSVDLSQEIQIQGRTARQGNPGTYTLVIPVQDMELLDMKPEAANNFLNELQRAREARQNKQWSQIVAQLNQSNIKHQNCLNIYKNQKVEEKQIIEYIKQLNGFQQIRASICKTIILSDATGSMSAVLQKLLSILGEVVKDIIDITSNFKSSSSSQLQLGVYRNYNCSAQMVFQSTPFESQAHNLLSFLKNVYAAGGMGNEAIETAYYHINSIPGVDQVIIIGDAPANSDQQTVMKRSQKGQRYWNSNNIPSLSANNQLNHIVNKGIPIHSFYINTQPQLGTQAYFTNVSNRTRGRCEEFNVHGHDSSKRLSQFIAERILEKVARDSGQAVQMVNMYRRRHSL